MTTFLIGCASGIAGADEHSGDGPKVMRQSPVLETLEKLGHIQWQAMLTPTTTSKRKDENLRDTCVALASDVSTLVKEQKFFCVLGGDHSCAIGTWSGVYDALHTQGDIGLIWIDAHMDSHTPETTLSGNIHGMPLACLLGFGYPTLTSVLNDAPKMKPENVCLIGVRSYEAGEEALLKRLNVKIFFMDEVKQRGFEAVLQDAIEHVTKHTSVYGVSLDLDGLDPLDAPGVDVPEPDGIRLTEMLPPLIQMSNDKRLIGVEIVEFDPSRDREGITEKAMTDIISVFAAK